jgi:hypothetical protein
MRQETIELRHDRRGYMSIRVLECLNGKPLDEYAMALIHALRPSSVRVSHGGWTNSDARTWRVTVYQRDGLIDGIEQEVEVGLPDGCPHGSALDAALRARGIEAQMGRLE